MGKGPFAPQTAGHTGRTIMWALGLLVGALVGAAVAQGTGAFIGAILGTVIGAVIGHQRTGVKRRVEKLESQMLELESRIAGLDERAAVAGRISIGPDSTPMASLPAAEAVADPSRTWVVPGSVPAPMGATAAASARTTALDEKAAEAAPASAPSTPVLPVRQGGR